MNLDYITINGLDVDVKKKLEEDMGKRNYTGPVSRYVTQLLNEALSQREKEAELTSKESVANIEERLMSIEEKLTSLEKAKYEKDWNDGFYQKLICRTNKEITLLCHNQGIDTKLFEDGTCDSLPYDLVLEYMKVERQYGNA